MTGPLLIDVDTGVDDAIALAFLARRAPGLMAVMTVAGNVPIDSSTENSLRVLSWLGRSEIPVHRGASRPLAVPYFDAAHVHGGNGLGNVELPNSDRSEAENDAVGTILNFADRYSSQLTILTLGPLTNLAIALSLRPRLTTQISRVVVMGGAFFNPGNVTPHAEFNVYADPHAAAQVLTADWAEIIVLGLDVTHRTVISRATWEGIPQSASAPARLARQILERTYTERNLDGFYLHDPLAALVTVDSEFISGKNGAIDVVLDGEQRGKTRFREGEGTAVVAVSVAAESAERAICDALDIEWVGQALARDNAE